MGVAVGVAVRLRQRRLQRLRRQPARSRAGDARAAWHGAPRDRTPAAIAEARGVRSLSGTGSGIGAIAPLRLPFCRALDVDQRAACQFARILSPRVS